MLETITPELIEKAIDCPDCGGTGYLVDNFPHRVNRPGEEQMIGCSQCGGVGEIVVEVCSACRLSDRECNCLLSRY